MHTFVAAAGAEPLSGRVYGDAERLGRSPEALGILNG